MLDEYKTKTNIGIFSGWVLQAIGKAQINSGNDIGYALGIAGLIVFMWGCGQYARGKGHSELYGLLGFFNIFGLLVLFFLKDGFKKPRG